MFITSKRISSAMLLLTLSLLSSATVHAQSGSGDADIILQTDLLPATGLSLSVSGNRLATCGRFYELVARTWTEVAQFSVPCDVVAIDGNYAFMGNENDRTFGLSSGSVIVFEFSSGAWQQAETLYASDAQEFQSFGTSVAVNGNTLVVAADGDDEGNRNGGATYVFERIGGNWTEVEKLLASDSRSNDRFGTAVSVSGNTIVVGADQVSHSSSADDFWAGAAYVFERVDGVWTEVTKLITAGSERAARFGSSVSISDNLILVGAPGTDGNSLQTGGSAYIFERGESGWSEIIRLKGSASNATGYEEFGESVAIEGNRALVGAPGARLPRASSGYIYEPVNGRWTETLRLQPDNVNGSFGTSVALSGDYALAGRWPSPAENSVYVFDLAPSGSCFDPDGDGWGWDGVASCRVNNVPSLVQCVDPDGDGWGWDGVQSCQVNSIPPAVAECVDPDGDGWGWDGVQSCRAGEPVQTVEPALQTCVDTDGDGWGWDGTSSCRP